MPWYAPSQQVVADLTIYLPSELNDSTAPAGNIRMPLQPETMDWLGVRIVYDRSFKAADGGELVTSLAVAIYYAWVDATNEPIRTPTRGRREPFPNFQFTIRPSAAREAVLTPLKLGIAYCWILNSILEEQPWPGSIHADVIENNYRSIGALDVADIPQSTGTPSEAQADKDFEKILFANEPYSTTTRPDSNANGPASALAIPTEIERRWFKCLSKMLLYIVARPTSGSVASELPPYPFSTDVRTYHFHCAPEDPNNKDQFDVYISWTSKIAEYRLTWDALAKTLLILGTRVAQGGDWDIEQLVVHRDVVTAALGITLDGASGATVQA
ncbi:MAG: hypothetical protein Q9208_003718 [Pyrenodesmia sp. 3 TL-2023]